MPGSWSGGDPAGDDDADDAALGPPMHPDDRLWRHPSEVAWTDRPESAPDRVGRPTRTWALALTSALTGAALALGIVALVGGLGVVDTGDGPNDLATLRDSTPADTSTGLAAIADTVLPSIVRIDVLAAEGERVGTGIVVLDDGHVLTNAHVVDGAEVIELVVDGTAVPGRLVGLDLVTDLAVVAPAAGEGGDVEWIPATWGSTDDLDVGQPVVAVGAAATRALPSLSVGAITALGRRLATSSGGALHGMIETDAPFVPEATGGALCDESGVVVGLSTATVDATGAGYATPMDAAWAVAEDLMDDGIVRYVWLGIEGTDGAMTSGVIVERVMADSPAAEAGLRTGDVVVELGGYEVHTMSDLVMALRAHDPGDDVAVHATRDGETVVVETELVERETD